MQDDLISRQEAIKAIDEKAKRIKNEHTLNGLAGAVGILFDLPSYNSIKTELSGDAVSRQDAYKCLEIHGDYNTLNEVYERLEKLPSVNPQPTGHWIIADEQNKEDVENDNYRFICSECQCSDIHAKGTIVPYCWKCGRRMVEPQEGE